MCLLELVVVLVGDVFCGGKCWMVMVSLMAVTSSSLVMTKLELMVAPVEVVVLVWVLEIVLLERFGRGLKLESSVMGYDRGRYGGGRDWGRVGKGGGGQGWLGARG